MSYTKWSLKISLYILALLCATTHQSYCRHTGVRPSSVKPDFSEAVKQINTTFGGIAPFHHNSKPFFFCFKIVHF